MFQIANLFLGIYIIWRCITPLKISNSYKTGLSLVVLLFIEHHWLVSKIFNTSIPSPELPRIVLMVLGAAYGLLLMLAILMFLRDLTGLILFPASRSIAGRIWGNGRLTLILICLSLVASLWGVREATKVPSVRHIEVTLPGLAPDMDGYRMVLLTDLHISRLLPEPWAEALVKKTNALNASLIVISGDLVDGTTHDRQRDIAPLASLYAPDGVYAVAGNHEYYAEYGPWLEVFRNLGITMLENQHVTIRAAQGGFVLAGVPDEVATEFGQHAPDLVRALKGRQTGLPVVLLDHRPGHMRANQAQGVDLQLSGHTHGGHIRGIDLIVSLFNDGFVSGRYTVNDATLYVSNGAGLWPGFSTRIGRPSEITLITLRSSL